MKLYLKYFILNIFINIISSQNQQYIKYDYEHIMTIFENLSKTCSHYIRIDTSQKRYNLDSIDGCGKNNCTNLIVFMTDFDSYTLDRPAYYISGILHGDEVLGPTSVTNFAQYFCDTFDIKKNSLYHNILKNKIIIMTPMTNSFGYYNKQREEKVFIQKTKGYKLVDPNRDFPYNSSNDDIQICMQTLTARTINEIFNEFIIGGAITFHGGTSIISYAWGNNIHVQKINNVISSTEVPDFNAFNNIGKIMVKSSSSKDNLDNNIKDYILGDMTSKLYPLDGALEDWAYGGWENNINKKYKIKFKPIKTCKPDSFSEYHMTWNFSNINENIYSDIDNDYKLRCLMFLVEASDNKEPKSLKYGNKNLTTDIFDFYNTKNFFGLIPRNMRMIYSGIDLISASIYLDIQNISIKSINDYSNQITIPFLFMGCLSLKKYSIYKINFDHISKKMIEKTTFQSNSNINSNLIISEVNEGINCYFNNLTYYNLSVSALKRKNITSNRNLQDFHKNYKGGKVDHFTRPGGNYDYLGTLLNSKNLKFDKYMNHKGSIYYIQGEGPDQEWKNQKNPDPKVEPQSHVVRSKVNSSYFVKNGNYSLKSNYYFYSYPVVVFDNGEVYIVDDIDSFFYDKDLDLMQIIANPTENNFQIISQIYCQRKPNENNIYLTSENIFEINLEMHIYENKGNKLKKSLKNKLKYNLNSQILLSDENDIFHLHNIDCEANNEIGLVLKCTNLFNNITINGRFIRQKLANSILRFELKAENEILLNFFGQISLKNDNMGKYFINYYSNRDSRENNRMICSSNFPNFIGQINDTINKNYQDDIYYDIFIDKISSSKFKLIINVEQKRKRYNYFMIFFPFNKIINVLNIKQEKEIIVDIDDSINGKIIGKTVYVIPIEDKDRNIISKMTFNLNDFSSLIFSLNKASKNKNYKYMPCSIMSFNSFRNEESYKEYIKMNEKFTNKTPFVSTKKETHLLKNIIIIFTLILALIIIYQLVIKKLWNSSDNYDEFNSVTIADINDFSQNRF